MAPFYNQWLFKQTQFDSDALSVLAACFHCVRHSGVFYGSVTENGLERGEFRIVVSQTCPDHQLNVDLSSLVRTQGGPRAKNNQFCLRQEGTVVFFASRGRFSLSVSLVDESGMLVFDNRALSTGDRFACVPLRPGLYAVSNTVTRAKARLEVRYPSTHDHRVDSQGFHNIVVQDDLEPDEITSSVGQGIVFEIQQKARILVTLDTPYDAPRHLEKEG